MKLTFAVLVTAACAAKVLAQPIADSVAEFSGVQGESNWYYGLYNASADFVPGYDHTADFTRFPVFSGSGWSISDSFWTSMGADSVHPNGAGNNGGKVQQGHYPIRRWVCTATGLVRLHGHVAKYNTGGGDGVAVYVYVNGQKKFEQSLGAHDGSGFDYSLGVGLKVDDVVDFLLYPGPAGDSTFDGTTFTAVVDRAEFTLSTATAVEVGVPTVPGQQYQIYHTLDLATWRPVAAPFTGTGDMKYLLFSIRELGSPGFFKAEALP